LQLARRRGEVGELVAAGVYVRPETGQRQLFGERHAAEGVILLEDEHLQARPGEVAGAGEAVLAGADADGIMARRHAHSLRAEVMPSFYRAPSRAPMSNAGSGPELSQ